MASNPRSITGGEEKFLRAVFVDTLPYSRQQVAPNTDNLGGKNNSITPGSTPFMSTNIWCADFSDPSVSKLPKSSFVHEFVHVWQFYHGITKLSAMWLYVRNLGDYAQAYPYDLSDSDDLTDYNIEQQASIIQDWWLLTNGELPRHNTGKTKTLAYYQPHIDAVRAAGPPYTPMIPTMRFRH